MPNPTPHAALHLADWADAARRVLGPSSVDFLYADPPFNTGSAQRSPPNSHKRAAKHPLPAGGGGGWVDPRRDHEAHHGELDPPRPFAPASYPDSWPDMPAYIAFLRGRLVATLPALKPSAIVAIHCDFRASHHIRLLLDDLLGPHNFVNHLIWHYGLGGSSPRRFARKHDDILVYCLDQAAYYFDPPRVPATSHRLRGRTKKATDVLVLPEAPCPSVPTEGGPECPTLVDACEALSDSPGSLLDIPSLNNMAHERTGYPTQKPLALLEILVRAFCPPAGVVLDPCCGSGTTLVAALRCGRHAIGFDTSPDAIGIARRRTRQG